MGEDQRALAKLWKAAPAGKLSPWSQAKAWALREAWNLTNPDSTYGRTRWIAERLHVEGRTRQHPTEGAVTQFFTDTLTSFGKTELECSCRTYLL